MNQVQFDKSFKGNNRNLSAMNNEQINAAYTELLNDYERRDFISNKQKSTWKPFKFMTKRK